MNVILLQDIKGVGKKGDLLNASDGHARNYLIPRKLAVEATKSNLNELELKQKSLENKRQQELLEAQELAKTLEEKVIKIEVKIGENGKLFGSVTNKEIAEALSKQAGINIDKKKIVLEEPIKNIGDITVGLKIHPKVTARLKVQIISNN